MKWWVPTILMYGLICMIGLFLPASPGYDAWSWKLLVVQLYAVPISLLVLAFNYWTYKKTMSDVR